MVFLEQLRLRNYRSCKVTGFHPHPALSCLIGPNGSGKSNVLNGILLLSRILRPYRHFDEEQNVLSVCKIEASFDLGGKSVAYESVVRYITNDKNVDEVIAATDRWNFKSFTDDATWIEIPIPLLPTLALYYERNDKSKNAIAQLRLFDAFTLAQRGSSSRLKSLMDTLPSELISRPISDLAAFISGIAYYSASQFTDPSKAPNYFEIASDNLERKDASVRRLGRKTMGEHAQFMYDLFLTYKNKPKKFQEYMSIVGKNGVGLIDRIKYREVRAPARQYEVYAGGKFVRKEVAKYLIIPTFVVQGVQLSPNQLSEGTFKTLAILYYLVTDESKLLLLEEPEVCIHHGLLASVLQLIKDFSNEKQIVISTHSDFVLDGLDPNNVFIVKYQPDRGTKVQPVPKAMSRREYKALREYLDSVGNLGEYWRHGNLEQ
jgi:energy-coupling factor transporter ATP-binding protein EcfA2